MKSLFTLLTLTACFALNAQTITNFKTADGLPNDNVLCLTADASNNMWFGTQTGVAKFDGTNWSIFNQTSHPTIPNNTIKAIAAMKNGDIWIGTDNGIGVYDGSKWTSYDTDDGLGSNRINYITEVSNGDVWISDFNGATKYSSSTFTKYGTSDGLPFGGVQQIQEAKNGDIVMATGLGGIASYDGSTFTIYNATNGLVSNSATSLAINNEGDLWVGTGSGVSVFDSSYKHEINYTRMYVLPAPDTLNPVEDVKMDSKGRMWVGIYVDYLVTEGGVSMYDGSKWTEFDVSSGLAGPTIRNLAVDKNDNVWVATSTGVSRINSGPSSTQSLQANSVSMYPNPTHHLLTIELDQTSVPADFQIEVYNSQSKLEMQKKMNSGTEATLNLSSLSPGIYIVRIANLTRKVEVY